MDIQAAGIRTDPAKTRAIDPAREIEIAFQPTFGQLDAGEDALAPAEAQLSLDRRIGGRSSGVDGLREGVKERDYLWRFVS